MKNVKKIFLSKIIIPTKLSLGMLRPLQILNTQSGPDPIWIRKLWIFYKYFNYRSGSKRNQLESEPKIYKYLLDPNV